MNFLKKKPVLSRTGLHPTYYSLGVSNCTLIKRGTKVYVSCLSKKPQVYYSWKAINTNIQQSMMIDNLDSSKHI